MRKFTSLAILGLMWLAGSAAFADEHEYRNGICTMHDDCDEHFQRPVQDADGFYMLYNVGNVEWISQQVADNNIALDCKLMNDIDYENVVNLHSPIGPSNGRKYNATFDGQGFRIKNMIINRPDSEMQGFFGSLRGNPNTRGQGTVIKNLIIDKSCSITGGMRTGGITGAGQNSEREINIINCVNEADITSPSNNCGGIVGGSHSSHPIWKITNCVNTGKITSTASNHEAAGIASWIGDNGSTIVKNCINIGEISDGAEGSGMDASGRGVYRQSRECGVNCYDLSGNEMAFQHIDYELTPDDVLNGKATYIINQRAKEIVYYQTIGVDKYPMPFSTSRQVYLQGELTCDGTPIEGGTYTNDPVEPVRPPHDFVDGDFYCINCGQINENFCEKDADGFYQLNDEVDVCWFAEFVTAGYVDVNAKLNKNLDFTDYDFLGIGDRDHGFKGIFDGGFHTISNLTIDRPNDDWIGFINFLNGGATVKNLRGDATCFFNAHGNAGLIGGSTAPGDIYLENLGFEGDVTCQRAGAGGILGCNTGSQAHIYMTNCYSTGFISGSEVMENGALSAWLGGDGAVITNCWSTATVSGYQDGEKYLARFNSATFTNCYCVVSEEDIAPLYTTVVDFAELKSGALCYKLNGNQENITWYQTLGQDAFPTFMPGHGQVYAVAEMRCDGTFASDDVTYSNASGSVIPPHQFDEGFCIVCHQQDPDFTFLEVFANADHDTSEGYINSGSNDGSGLAINNSVAEHWNQQWFESYQTIKGLEPGIYRLRLQGLQRAEQWSNDEGAAYESGELSEEYAPLYHSSQYFAEVNGKRIANRFMDIAQCAQKNRVNETENHSEVTDKWVPNSLAACNKYFGRGLYWNEPLYFAIENVGDSVNIGVENSLYLYGNWTVWDSWRLDKLTEGDIDLIRAQQIAAIQDELEDLQPQATLMEAYNEAKEAIENAVTLDEIMAVADVLARNPNLIRRSHLAYEAFMVAIQAIAEERAARDDLYGDATDLLDKYLSEDEEASEELPNGTYLNIIDIRVLNEEELTAEIAFARELLDKAILASIVAGSDVSSIIKNPGFDADGNFKDWETERIYDGPSGSNFSSNTGFTDIYPVAGTWNTAFTVSQYIVADIPDGIYELEAPAFYRPGGNGQGNMDGTDYVPADLFINDYYTPIMNIYAGQVLYNEAKNGVNCRYDASGDPSAPHNGEITSSQDFDTGMGYVPEQRQAVSFAFSGGRYVNKVYGVVSGGQLRIGIRNTGKPWYESGMTMWGRFKLTYCGQSEDVINSMMDNFRSRLEALKWGREEQRAVYYSLSHIDNLEAFIAEADEAPMAEKMAAIKKINDEFNTILDSYDAYESLRTLGDYCDEKANEYYETDPDLGEAYAQAYDEIYTHYLDGDLTDEEARNYRETILNDPALGGGFYVQGDLLDPESGENLDYGTASKAYFMEPQSDGTFAATIKVQNRSNRAGNDARAGIYVTRMEERYECTSSSRRFITPAMDSFKMVLDDNDNHIDFQTLGGEYKVIYNPADSSVVFRLIGEYPWNNNAYVVGSIININGEQHRWKNDEMAPLAHKGEGVYEGIVTFYQDPDNSMHPNFTIFGNRSNTGAIEHSTATRGGWNEARYGSETDKLILEDGVTVGDLIRGSDRKWYLNWDESNTGETQAYTITFDMNRCTVVASIVKSAPSGDVNGDSAIDIADVVKVLSFMAEDATAEEHPEADVNGDGAIDIADVVKVLSIMAEQ